MMTARFDALKTKRSSESSTARSVWFAVGLLIFTTLLAYSNSFTVPFIFDDRPAILENASIRHLWPIGDVLSPPSTGGNTVSGRPLLNLSLALNFAISGPSAWSYHAFNLALHLLAALTLFGLVRRVLELPALRSRFAPDALAFALSVAVLWAVHPLSTQAITYIVQRAEALMGFFYLLTLYAFVRSLTAPRSSPWLGLSVFACLCGMATKESMISAPLIILLFDRTLVAGTVREAWRRRRLYYAGLAGTWLLLAYLVASTGGNRGGSLGFGAGVAWWTYASTEFQVIVRYLALSVWPRPLVFEYDLPWARQAWDIIPYAFGVAALVIATVVGLVKRSVIGVAGAWFFAILAPTSSIVPMQSIAEYRMYLPLAPVLCIVVAGLYAGLGRAVLPVMLALALVLGGLTMRRNTDYQSELALWGDTVAKRPENARARCNFGIALVKAGRLADGVEQLTEALRLKPDFAEAHGSLGYALLQTGRAAAALVHLAEAVRLKPYDAEAQNNLGNALLQLDRVTEAGGHFAQAVTLKPDFVEAHFNLGNVLLQSGRGEEAIQQYELALRLAPNDAEIHNNLGNAYYQAGRLEDAKEQFETTVRLRPGDAEGFNNLGLVLYQLQRPNEARAAYEQALRLRPTFPEALANLSALNAESAAVAKKALK